MSTVDKIGTENAGDSVRAADSLREKGEHKRAADG